MTAHVTRSILIATLLLLRSGGSLAQVAPAATPAAAAPAPVETVATEIAGVIKGGTRVELLKTGLSGTEGPLALADGSLVFTEREANRITRVDPSGRFSTYLENPNGTNSLSFDARAG